VNYDVAFAEIRHRFDDEIVGYFTVGAPAKCSLDIKVHGKASHAGVAPEEGISAIIVAGACLSKLKVGKIDAQTTANKSRFNGRFVKWKKRSYY